MRRTVCVVLLPRFLRAWLSKLRRWWLWRRTGRSLDVVIPRSRWSSRFISYPRDASDTALRELAPGCAWQHYVWQGGKGMDESSLNLLGAVNDNWPIGPERDALIAEGLLRLTKDVRSVTFVD